MVLGSGCDEKKLSFVFGRVYKASKISSANSMRVVLGKKVFPYDNALGLNLSLIHI